MQLKGRRLTFDRDAEDLQNRALESLAAGRVVLGLPIPIYPRATIVLVSDASRRQTILLPDEARFQAARPLCGVGCDGSLRSRRANNWLGSMPMTRH
jgi:hypothetical protein